MRDYFEKKFELARKNNKMIMLVRERSTGKLVGMTLYDLSVSKSRYRSKYYHEDPMRQEEAYLYDWVVENVPEAVNDDDKLDLMQFMDSMVTGVRNRNKTRDEHMIEMKGIFENPEIYKTELSPLPSLAHYAQTLALVIVGVALDGIPDYPHELEAVAYVDLVCSDPGWSGYGVSKGLFRHLTNMARILARANNLKQAYLRLEVATGDDDEPDDELVQLYESYGLMSEEPDSKYFTSPNLMEGDLKLDGSTPSEPVPEKQGLERPKNEQTTRDSWTRNGTTFDITLKQTEQITPQEERQMSAFCGNLSYWFDLTFEIEKTRRATMSLVTERNSKKIVGFCLYKMLLKQCPFTRKYREQYESDMERYDEAAYMYEWILDNIPEITDIDARTELAELLFNFYLNVSTSTRRTKEEWAKFYTDVFHDPSFIGTQLKKLPPLTKYVDSIVKLIVGVAVNGIPENYIREAELFIKLICSDEAWRGYGVSKGLFRHLVDLVKGAATQGNLRRATIRLDISRKHGEPNRKLVGMYRSYGMKSMKPGDEDETEYISPNLMEEDLTL